MSGVELELTITATDRLTPRLDRARLLLDRRRRRARRAAWGAALAGLSAVAALAAAGAALVRAAT